MLSFLIDHNVPKSVSRYLQDEGFDVKLVKELDEELPDEEVLVVAKKEQRIVVTNDRDYVGLSPFHESVDIILFAFTSQRANVRIAGLKRTLVDLQRPFGLLIIQ
jgi:predicted nuclease of predicted toxin-antitoxin system